MPNTLAHIGAQLPLTRILFSKVDPRWVTLGLLIPDLPWIYQRLVLYFLPTVSPIDVRAFVVVMSTPLFCMLFSAAIALLFRGSRWIFILLSLQCLLHLLLDCIQEKGGVGVPFFGPFDWQSFSWPLFPMDGWISTLLTCAGGCCILWLLRGKLPNSTLGFPGYRIRWRILGSTILVLIYTLAPLALMQNAVEANVHDLKLWSGSMPRTGMQAHFDRANFIPGPIVGVGEIQDVFNPEPIPIMGIDLQQRALISTIATFKDETTLVAGDYVIHPTGRRFWFTIAGLAGVALFWIYPCLKKIPDICPKLRDQTPPDSNPREPDASY